MKAEKVVPKLLKEQIASLLANGKRVDGRRLDEYRPINIKVNTIEKAEGSALIKIGETMVLAGVKVEIGSPFPDAPDKGVFTVNAEFVPLASPTFEPGPPDEDALELSRVVDRGIREAKAIDLDKLCLIPSRKVWNVWIDIYILNHDGNLIDASMLASIASLLTTKIPIVELGGDEVKLTDKSTPLPMLSKPISITLAKIGGSLIVDPSLREEQVMDCRLTIALNEDGKICALQKGVSGYLKIEEIHKAVEIALSLYNKLKIYIDSLTHT